MTLLRSPIRNTTRSPLRGPLDDAFGGGASLSDQVLALSPRQMYDASDIANVYQSTDTATPVTATGQAVSRLTNLVEDAGHLLRVGAVGTAPQWIDDGTLKYLRGDGVDDQLEATNANPSYTGPRTIVACGRRVSATANMTFFGIHNVAAWKTVDTSIGALGWQGLNNAAVTQVTASGANDWFTVAVVNRTASDGDLWFNGLKVAAGLDLHDILVTAPDVSLFATQIPSQWGNFDFIRGAVFHAALSDAEIGLSDAWLREGFGY